MRLTRRGDRQEKNSPQRRGDAETGASESWRGGAGSVSSVPSVVEKPQGRWMTAGGFKRVETTDDTENTDIRAAEVALTLPGSASLRLGGRFCFRMSEASFESFDGHHPPWGSAREE